jgi:hypothetical protein
MGTFTAQILIGQGHPYHDGIGPSHYLFLSENSRPAWILVPQNIFDGGQRVVKPKITWIPTIENMLEDALLMTALYVWRDEELCNMARRHFKNKRKNRVELYKDIEPEHLQAMYQRSRSLEIGGKIIVSVFEYSTILNQLKVLEQYKMDMEVCVSKYFRSRSVWDGQIIEKGSL